MADTTDAVMRTLAELRSHASQATERADNIERLLGIALHAGRMAVCEWDLASDRIHFSSHAERVLGIEREELPRDFGSYLDLVHPADREIVASVSQTLIGDEEGPDSTEIEYRIHPRNDRIRWLHVQARTLRHPDGRPDRIVGTLMDVSERKELESQLMQSQKMESVGRLAGGVAHDFNNLLTAIFGELELATSDLQPSSELRASLGVIREAAERASQLTSQLLAFARQQVFALQTVDLNGLVLRLADLLGRLLGEDIRLELATSQELWRVRVDPHQVEQVIVNLSVNAREAMIHGGTLTIETRSERVTPESARMGIEPGDYAVVSVRDTGTGMDESVRERAFEPFFTTKEMGTGLGLATCYGIVQQLGGQIRLDSEPGRGTTVQMFLPRSHESPTEVLEAPKSPAEGHEVVLVVEDEPAVRSMTVRGLRKHGYTVLEAMSGHDALERIESSAIPIDLVVSDVVMPEMSGRELAQRVVAVSPETRLLFVSGYTDSIVARHGLGEDEAEVPFLQKPYTPATLARKVRSLLDEKPPGERA